MRGQIQENRSERDTWPCVDSVNVSVAMRPLARIPTYRNVKNVKWQSEFLYIVGLLCFKRTIKAARLKNSFITNVKGFKFLQLQWWHYLSKLLRQSDVWKVWPIVRNNGRGFACELSCSCVVSLVRLARVSETLMEIRRKQTDRKGGNKSGLGSSAQTDGKRTLWHRRHLCIVCLVRGCLQSHRRIPLQSLGRWHECCRAIIYVQRSDRVFFKPGLK